MTKLPRKILCLDWDRRSLRMVVARLRAGGMDLEDAHSHRLPSNLDAEDPKTMGEFIAQMLRRHQWTHKRVIVSVPRERAVINTLTMPPTPADELASAVRFSALKELPFPIDEAVIDFAVTARENKNLTTQVLLAAVRKEALVRLTETCAAAGLIPVRIGLRPYANLRSVVRAHETGERRVLFVDVGPALTEIDILRGSSLAFSRSANVSLPYPHPGELVGEDSRISSKAALEGVAAADEASDEAVESLLVEITRTLQAYRAADPNAVVDEIIIAGGTGIETELATAAARRFNLPCALFDPGRVLAVDKNRASELRAFSAVLGLTWGLTKDGSLEVDFLNPKRPVPPRQGFKRRLRAGGIAAGLLLAVGATAGAMYYSRQRSELDTLNSQVDKLLSEVKAQVEVRNAVDEIDEWARESVWLDDLLALTDQLQQSLKEKDYMRVARVTFSRPTSVVTLKILSSDSMLASQLIDKLNAFERSAGHKAYRARTKTWLPLPNPEDKFKGSVDIDVELLELKKHDSAIKKNADERKKRLKNILQAQIVARSGGAA